MKRTSTAAVAVAAVAGGIMIGQTLPVAAAPAAVQPLVQVTDGPTPGATASTAPAPSAPATPTATTAPTAAPGTPGSVSVRDSATEPLRILTLGAAQRLANAALRDCAARGFQVAVSVVDRDGIEIITIRDEDATGATVQVAAGKARAAVGFRRSTAQLQQAARTAPGFEALPGFVILPGGQPISRGNDLVGGIGVSGAPSGAIDDACIDVAESTVA